LLISYSFVRGPIFPNYLSHLGGGAPFDISEFKIGPEPLIFLAPRAGVPRINKIKGLHWQTCVTVSIGGKVLFAVLANAVAPP
jgi:hypothetical protein